ncbi:MAG: hypothetical protein AAFV26_09530 [Pseudomonadota bacterium]
MARQPSSPPTPAKPATSGSDTRIAPDPLIVVLPALSALAAVTCITSVTWATQEPSAERTRAKRKAASALRDLETCCVGLDEVFSRLKRNRNLFGGTGAAAAAPIKFGVHGPRVTPDETRLFHQLMNDTVSMLVLATQNAFDVMAAIEDGELKPPEHVIDGLGEAQDTLNQLMGDKVALRVAVDSGAEIAQRLLGYVREIKSARAD